MVKPILILLLLIPVDVAAQAWSSFLDTTRAIDWTAAGFTIPSYTVPCATQPTLVAGSGNASTNATAIQTALASCDSTHNVVNLPAGTFYVAGFNFGTQGKQVLRGATGGTYIFATSNNNCEGFGGWACMMDSVHDYPGSGDVLPPSGTRQCLWTAGYAKGTTSIMLNTCPGGGPPVGQTLIIDQADDASDNSALYVCGTSIANCNSAGTGFNYSGRLVSGVAHSQEQTVLVTAVSGTGTGPFTVTISPGVYFNNVRSGQSPGAWWPGFVQNDGIENLTIDYSQNGAGATDIAALTVYDCYQCWVKGVRSISADRNHVFIYQSAQDVIRDSYFYQSAAHNSQSYGVEPWISSAVLTENNIFQQLTDSIMAASITGSVFSYNFDIGNIYTGSTGYLLMADEAHNAGNELNLWEGNILRGISSDIEWGSSPLNTYFRNSLAGWQSGMMFLTMPIRLNSYQRGYNAVGNVLGQPAYHDTYESYATSTTVGVNGAKANTSIYELGWSDNSGQGVCTTPPVCDPLVRSTLMRWGNYDTVTPGITWNSTEASPGAVTYISANFSTSYFNTLAHTLPASLHYSSTPSWWPSGKNWPPVGPDVTTGNVGICTATYAGAQATVGTQCTGGVISPAWASHVTSIPAMDCALSLGMPPDGSGAVLNFNAATCYSAVAPPKPPSLLILGTNTGITSNWTISGTPCGTADCINSYTETLNPPQSQPPVIVSIPGNVTTYTYKPGGNLLCGTWNVNLVANWLDYSGSPSASTPATGSVLEPCPAFVANPPTGFTLAVI